MSGGQESLAISLAHFLIVVKRCVCLLYRFLQTEEGKINSDKFAYIPFGAGEHCLLI